MAEDGARVNKDFFISYNKADRFWAEWIAWQLEEAGGYSVAIQAWDFGPSSNFVLEMDRAIKECERVLAVLSPDYVSSLFTQPEWAVYFARDPTAAVRRIVSVRVRECELTGLLAPIVYTDLVGKQEGEAKRELLDSVKAGRRKPESAPSFPGCAPRAVTNKPRFPGTLPEIWNVPHLRNPNFTEPGNRLIELRDALRSGKPAALTQALSGLGGVGKSSLAVEYAYRHAGDHNIVWWLRCEQPATLASDYAALAQKLDLPEKGAAEQPAIISAVREALRHRNDWLLIFDNAEAPEGVRDYLPGAGGHVLVTSRNASWGKVAQKVEVKKWPSDVAIDFLIKRTGQIDRATAAELAHEMGCLPLALEQAAAFVESTGSTLADYLALFKTNQIELLKRGDPSGDYPQTVATTWEISFQGLEREAATAVEVLHICAFFAPDDIPRDLIAGGVAKADVNALAFSEALAALRRYSLVETGSDSTLSIHRLVQAVIRDRLGDDGRKQWAEVAVKIVNAVFPDESNDVRAWKECARLLPHAIATTNFAESLGVGLKSVARLINQLGTYSWGRADYATAKAAFGRALRIDERVFGLEHPNVAIRVNNLGNVLQALGDLPGAKAAFERALRIDEKALGAKHPNVAIRVNNLGSVLHASGDLPGAKAAYERALRIDENAFDPDHPRVAIEVNNLGRVLQDLGDLPGAKAAFERALRIDEKTLGTEHPKVAIRVNNLGSVLYASGDLPGAKAAYERALHIDERAFGPEHPEVAIDVGNLGGVLRGLGDLPGATAAFERALAIFSKFLGDEHPNTKGVRENLRIVSSELHS